MPAVDGQDELLERAVGDTADEVFASSEMGAAGAALTARFALDGRPIGLNLFGEPLARPLSTATEARYRARGRIRSPTRRSAAGPGWSRPGS